MLGESQLKEKLKAPALRGTRIVINSIISLVFAVLLLIYAALGIDPVFELTLYAIIFTALFLPSLLIFSHLSFHKIADIVLDSFLRGQFHMKQGMK